MGIDSIGIIKSTVEIIKQFIPALNCSEIENEINKHLNDATKEYYPKWDSSNSFVQQSKHKCAKGLIPFLIGDHSDLESETIAVLDKWLFLVNTSGSNELKGFVQNLLTNNGIKKSIQQLWPTVKIELDGLSEKIDNTSSAIIGRIETYHQDSQETLDGIKNYIESLPSQIRRPIDNGISRRNGGEPELVKCEWDGATLKSASILFPIGTETDIDPSLFSAYKDKTSESLRNTLQDIAELSDTIASLKGQKKVSQDTLSERLNELKEEVPKLLFFSYLSNIMFAETNPILSQNSLWTSAKNAIDNGDLPRVLEILNTKSIEDEEQKTGKNAEDSFLTIANLWKARAVALESSVNLGDFEQRKTACLAYDRAVANAEKGGMAPSLLFNLLIDAAKITSSYLVFEKEESYYYLRSKRLLEKAVSVFETFDKDTKEKHKERLALWMLFFVDYACKQHDLDEAKSKFSQAMKINPAIVGEHQWAYSLRIILEQENGLFSLEEKESIIQTILSKNNDTAFLPITTQMSYYEDLLVIHKEMGNEDLVKQDIQQCIDLYDTYISEFQAGSLYYLNARRNKACFLRKHRMNEESFVLCKEIYDELHVKKSEWDEESRYRQLHSIIYDLLRFPDNLRTKEEEIELRYEILEIDRGLETVSPMKDVAWLYLQDSYLLINALESSFPKDTERQRQLINDALDYVDKLDDDTLHRPETIWQTDRILFHRARRDFSAGGDSLSIVIEDCSRIIQDIEDHAFFDSPAGVRLYGDASLILSQSILLHKKSPNDAIAVLEDAISYISEESNYQKDTLVVAKLFHDLGVAYCASQPATSDKAMKAFASSVEYFEKDDIKSLQDSTLYVSALINKYRFEVVQELYGDAYGSITKAIKCVRKLHPQYGSTLNEMEFILTRLFVHLVITGLIAQIEATADDDLSTDIRFFLQSLSHRASISQETKAALQLYNIILNSFERLNSDSIEQLLGPDFQDWLTAYSEQSENNPSICFNTISIYLFFITIHLYFEDQENARNYLYKLLEYEKWITPNDQEHLCAIQFAKNLFD